MLPLRTGQLLAFSIYDACFEGQRGILLQGYAELLKPESGCAVNVRMAALHGESPVSGLRNMSVHSRPLSAGNAACKDPYMHPMTSVSWCNAQPWSGAQFAATYATRQQQLAVRRQHHGLRRRLTRCYTRSPMTSLCASGARPSAHSRLQWWGTFGMITAHSTNSNQFTA